MGGRLSRSAKLHRYSAGWKRAKQRSGGDDLNQAAQAGLQQSINHVFDWIKDKGNELLAASGDPVLLMQSLVDQNFEMCKQAAKGTGPNTAVSGR